MNEKTKITLSTKELKLVCNTDWILTKHIIMDKVFQLFGELALEMQQYQSDNLSELILKNSPKIAKGERYMDLPYVMLDYPRYFGKNDTAAIRTFFLWGNFCSINLHLAGLFKIAANAKLIEKFTFFQQNDYFISVGKSPWEHHFNEDNFIPAKNISLSFFTKHLNESSFIKIAKKIPLQEWDNINEFVGKCYVELMELIPIKHPIDEKDL